VSQTGGFRSNTFEDVVNERVHDAHGLARNTSVWVDLLQDFEDVDGIRFLPLLAMLLGILRDVLWSLAGSLSSYESDNMIGHNVLASRNYLPQGM
jgi:hypothetical protein